MREILLKPFKKGKIVYKGSEFMIKCPKCGREFLPCEIFLPDYFLGKAKQIIRDDDGSIISFSGIEQDLEEDYVCENCNTSFKVRAKIDYEIIKNNASSFDEDYSTTIYTDRIKLKEED